MGELTRKAVLVIGARVRIIIKSDAYWEAYLRGAKNYEELPANVTY